ncbi:hypothetical protein PG988_011660 [Apiospora saccharicola]
MPSDLQAQWDLSATSTDVLSVARGVLIAASSDNVQPLAIMSCERFGNTLAMGRPACDHVKSHLLPTPEHEVVKFIKAVVGYSKNDAASELGQTQAGMQFLALAASLLSTMSVFDSAERIWAMLRTSARDKVLLPRQSQIRDLLARLEPRFKLSCFIERAQEWQTRLREWMRIHNVVPPSLEDTSKFPSSDGLEKLVDSFRQLRRVGSASITKIEINMRSGCTPWVAAFTEWCLDEKPSISLQDGRQVLNIPNSAVDITILAGLDGQGTVFEVILHHKVDGPRQLVNTSDQGPWTGMASIGRYGEYLFQQYELDADMQARVVTEILPIALHQVTEALEFSQYKTYDHTRSPERWQSVEAEGDRPSIQQKMKSLRVYPFPGLAALARTMEIMTKGDLKRLSPLEKGRLVADFPNTSTYLREISESCDCSQCAPGNPDTSASSDYIEFCDEDLFFHRLATVICDILALSLFYCIDELRVQIPIPQHSDRRNQLRAKIQHILITGETVDVDFTCLLDWALSLAGHNVSKQVAELDWIMSSESGQVVWPTVYDTNSIDRYGFLGLRWHRGELRYKDEVYRLVRSDGRRAVPGMLRDSFSDPVEAPLNLMTNLSVTWRVKLGDGVLRAGMSLEGMDGRYRVANICPIRLLANYASALVVGSCSHAPDTPLVRADAFCSFTGPGNPTYPASTTTGETWMKVGVVAVDGANDLRFFAIGCGRIQVPIVLRQSACLRCCLDVCRRTGFPVLVL